jgi:hypothetical protein
MEECGNDPRRYFARLKAAEARDRGRLAPKPKRTKQSQVSAGTRKKPDGLRALKGTLHGNGKFTPEELDATKARLHAPIQ